ncbi:MAG: hypothetical protein V4441_07310 [Pseudomonadota bacterium]
MTTEQQNLATARFVRLPSIAERKMGPGYIAPVRLDPRVLEQMQQTISVLGRQYCDTLSRQIHELLPQIVDVCSGVAGARHRFYETVHDMRGLAGTFGHPIVGRFAKSLCGYMEKFDVIDATIVRFYVEAMRDALEQDKPDERLADETLRSLEQLIIRTGMADPTAFKQHAG